MGNSRVEAHPAHSGHRVAALDGLRTLAILSVVAYHLGLAWLPSGHMGVVVFLVLTGYLVTCSVVREFARTRTVRLGSFWLRRLKRIWPPMLAMVVLVALACIACNHVLLTKMRPDIVPAFLGVLNWSYIVQGLSYFDQIGGPSPLTHLWYLGVDAQLCILWPLVLAALLRAGAGRRGVAGTALGLALVSAVLMGVLYDPGADPSRVYYGCDTRAFSVLVGAAFACVWPLGTTPPWARRLLLVPVAGAGASAGTHARGRDGAGTLAVAVFTRADAGGLAALAALVAIMVFVPSDAAFFYYGGMLVVSGLAVALMTSLLVSGGALARVFSLRPVVRLGGRSYALYLWHYPVIQLMGASGAAAAWWLQALAVAVSLGLAELSWIAVEKPLSAWRPMQRDGEGKVSAAEMSRRAPRLALAGGAWTVAVVAMVVGCAVVPETTLVPQDAIRSTGAGAGMAMDAEQLAAARSAVQRQGTGDTPALVDTGAAAGEGVAADGTQQQATPAVQEVPAGDFTLYTSDETRDAGRYEPLLIGDSVPGATAYYVEFPDGLIDSYVGRQPFQAVSVFEDYLAQGVVGDVVIFATFSNSTPDPEVLEQLVADAGPERQVYLVGTVNPQGFQDAANANLVACAEAHDNVHYVDWPAVAAGHEADYFWDDGTHLQPTGAWEYLHMMSRAVAPYMLEHGGTAVERPE